MLKIQFLVVPLSCSGPGQVIHKHMHTCVYVPVIRL